MTTDYPDWQTSQDQANAISTTGVPLLRGELLVTTGTTAALTPGQSANATGGPFQLLAPSYDLVVKLTGSAAVNNMSGFITLTWRESTNTTILAQKSFAVDASTGGHSVSLTGPVRGAKLTVTFQNSTVSVGCNITFAYTMVQSSRLAANDLCRTITGIGNGPPTLYTWAGTNNGDFGQLGNASPSVAGSGVTTRGLLMYNGPVLVSGSTSSALGDMELQIGISDSTVAVNQSTVLDLFSSANGVINALFSLPMAQCFVSLTNHNAAAKTLTFQIATAEPNVN